MFGLYMINDELITVGGLGILLGACALPSMAVPLIVGHAIDNENQEATITILLFMCEILGLSVFAIAVACRSFLVALLALLAFGIGTSSLSVVQRVLVTLFLKVWIHRFGVLFYHLTLGFYRITSL